MIIDKQLSSKLSNSSTEKKDDQKVFESEEGVVYLINEIKSRKNKQEGPLVVLIAGGSASGKTSVVADKVHKAFIDESIILSLDDYYKGTKFMKEMKERGIVYNYDQPEVVNLDLFKTHLTVLKSGRAIEKPIYNFSTCETERIEKVEPKKIILVEGLFALNKRLSCVGDIKVFVDVGTHGRLIRRILRSAEYRCQNPDDILGYFTRVVEPMHNQYIQSTINDADIVINNEYKPEIEARGVKEVQLKFAGVIGHEKLIKFGIEKLTSFAQVDTYYNPKDRNLCETGEALRIREENGHSFFSYKGPKKGGDFRVRSKIDFEINSEIRDDFVKMYGEVVTVIKKDRTIYQLNGVTFSVDKVSKTDGGVEKDLGNFVEIRGVNSSSESELNKVIEILGFKIVEGDKRAYSEM